MPEQIRKPNAAMKVVIILLLVIAVVGAVVARNASREQIEAAVHAETPAEEAKEKKPTAAESAATTRTLPKILDLGAGKCIPCQMMEPILDELREEYKGKFDVVFIDVWKNQSAGEKYGIRVIPTQIFFDAEGKELFRHEGFYSKEDILGKWDTLGIHFDEEE